MLNGLLDARVEQAPLLAITGMSYHDLIGTSYLQDVNRVKFLRLPEAYRAFLDSCLAPLMDPLLAIRTGSVPYWALFGTRASRDRVAGYLSRTHRYDDITMTVFPHGTDSIGLASNGEWQAVLGYARQHGELVAIDPSRYPRHSRALTGFHRELSRLPRIPALPPLSWEAARQYLAAHAPAFDVAFGEDRVGR